MHVRDSEPASLPIRRMREEDREAVRDMMRIFYSSDAVLTDGTDEIFDNDITACVSDSPYLEGYVFMRDVESGCDDGEIAGYAMLAHSFSTEYGRRCIWIEDIYLKDEARGLGLASRFLDYLADAYPDALHRLEAEHENAHAMEVYRRKGFVEMPYVELYR